VEDNFYVLGPSVRIQVGSDNLRLGIELAKQVVSAIQNFIEETEAAVAKRQKQ
jgi:hypothetical protein